MPWYRVSDDLPSKAETTRIPRAHRCQALGLWALAGAWSAQQLTDGHIPTHMLDELSGTPKDAEWLVAAGYWAAVDDGWQFVVWAPDQPLREAVLEQRRKNAEKVQNWRSRNKPSNPVTNPVGTPVSNPAPDPTRPDPPTSNEVDVHPPAELVNDLEQEFDEWWILYPRKQGKADARKAYKAARKDVDAATLRDGAQAYNLLNAGADKSYLKLPAGWIRGARWLDEQIPATPAKLTPGQVDSWAGYRTPITSYAECPSHPGYPAATDTVPCTRCERDATEPEEAYF